MRTPFHQDLVPTASHHSRGNDTFIARLNNAMDAHKSPLDLNESAIENLLNQWNQYDKCQCPAYWLVAARLFEMGVVTAGHYVDNCEFKAAGDLLFNPRKILIYRKGGHRPLTKKRHGRLSDQLRPGPDETARESYAIWFRHHAATRISEPAILPYLLHRLKQSGHLSKGYLQTAQTRLEKASQAIGFLCAGSIYDSLDLHLRRETASTTTRRFIDHNLCYFDLALYHELGEEVVRIEENPHHRSKFLETT